MNLTSARIVLFMFYYLHLWNGTFSGVGRSVRRRSLPQLCYQLDQVMGPSCLAYLGYGCYCGKGGQGDPVDDLDRCCQAHDRCYNQNKCFYSWVVYVIHYNVTCHDKKCHCLDIENTSSCAQTICECDRQFVECVKGAPLMNPEYLMYNRSQC